jgi:hypothetical protein
VPQKFTTATIKADISKDIRDARIKYHVRGETTNKTLFAQSVRDAKTNGVVFDLENLRSGQDYDAEITITDRFGVTSAIKAVSFKTTGNLSPNDLAIHAVSGFGKVLATLTTQVYISLYHEKLANPYAEQYNITVRDAQGNPVNWTAQGASIGTMDNGLLINGLSANTQYSYTILVTSRADIAPVSGTFKTAPGGDTTAPQTSSMSFGPKDPTSLVYGITPLESLKALLVTLTDQVTQIIKKYYFSDIATSVAKVFLLDGLDAGKRYLIKWLMFDTSGNISASNMNIILSTPALDETPPVVTENTLTERTDTTATFHLVSGEPIKKLRVRYRLVGDTLRTEQVLIPVGLAFDVNLAGLTPGQIYEYQYAIEDNAGNLTLTEWEKV